MPHGAEQAHDLAADPAVADHAERPAGETQSLRDRIALGPPVALVKGPGRARAGDGCQASTSATAAEAIGSGRAPRCDGDTRYRGPVHASEVDEVEADAVTREQHEPVDPFEAGLRHRRGIVVEAVDPAQELRRKWTGVLGEERPLDAVDFERREVEGRERRRCRQVARVAALDPDVKRGAIRSSGMPYDRFWQTDQEVRAHDPARRRRRASRRRIGAAHIECDPVGRPPLPLRPRPDRHARPWRSFPLTSACRHAACWIRSRTPWRKRGPAGARAARAVLPPRPGRTSTSGIPPCGRSTSLRRAPCGRRSSPGSRSGDADRGRGRPPASRRESSRRRRGDLRALLCLLPPPPRRRCHDRRPRARRRAHRLVVGQRRMDRARTGRPAAGARSHDLRPTGTPSAPTRLSISGRATCPASTPWLLRFCTHCNERDYDRGTGALAALGKPLLRPRRPDGRQTGSASISGSSAWSAPPPRRRTRGRRCAASRGCGRYGDVLPDDVLGDDEIHELEPSLNDRVKAGFHLVGAVERQGRHARRRARREAAGDGRRVPWRAPR